MINDGFLKKELRNESKLVLIKIITFFDYVGGIRFKVSVGLKQEIISSSIHVVMMILSETSTKL